MSLKIETVELHIGTSKSFEYVDITDEVKEALKNTEIKEGLIAINVLHTTAAIVLQEADSTVHEDAHLILGELVSTSKNYRHSYEGNINGAAHQRQQLLGNTCTIALHNGEPVLGTWQRIFLIELFRPMQRRVSLSILGY